MLSQGVLVLLILAICGAERRLPSLESCSLEECALLKCNVAVDTKNPACLDGIKPPIIPGGLNALLVGFRPLLHQLLDRTHVLEALAIFMVCWEERELELPGYSYLKRAIQFSMPSSSPALYGGMERVR